MKNRLSTLAAAALFAMSMVPFANNASAMPADALALKNAAPTDIETVRWRGRGGRGWGPGIAAGLLGGAIIGGLLAAPYTATTTPITPTSPAPTLTAPATVGTRWPTACSGSGLMIRTAARISASTACVIHAHERIAAAACAFPVGRSHRHLHTS